MKTMVRVSVAALALVVFAGSAAAQLVNVPIYTAPAGYQGILVAGGVGVGGNDDAKFAASSPLAYGGAVGFGTSMFNITGMVAQLDTKDEGGLEKEIEFGGQVGVTVMNKEAMPLAVNVYAGAGYVKFDNNGADFKSLNIPFGVGVGYKVPTTGVQVLPFVAPRGQFNSYSSGGASASQFGFGVSGGLMVNLPMGLGFHAALDWSTFAEKTGTDLGDLPKVSPLIFGGGIHYVFKLPGASAM
jgi:hypothetical protein